MMILLWQGGTEFVLGSHKTNLSELGLTTCARTHPLHHNVIRGNTLA